MQRVQLNVILVYSVNEYVTSSDTKKNSVGLDSEDGIKKHSAGKSRDLNHISLISSPLQKIRHLRTQHAAVHGGLTNEGC